MARALFICQVVLDSIGRAYPATEDIRNSLITGNFPCVWTITTFQDSRRIAIGLAEVNAAQLAAMELDSRIRVEDLPANWETLTWGSISNARQTSILNFLTNKGVDTSGITDALLLTELITLLCNRFRVGRKFSHLQNELSANFGV